MKPTKSKKKEVPAKGSNASIPDYFKATEKEPSKSVAPFVRDVKSVYVSALLNKVKNFDKDECNDTAARQVTADIGINGFLDQDVRGETLPAAGPIQSTLPDDPLPTKGQESEAGCKDCRTWKQKYEDVKKSYIKLSLRHTETLMKYDDLLKASTSNVRPTDDQSESVAASSDEMFTETELRYLSSIPLDKKKDSTFVLQCVEYAYKSDRKTLCNRTLKGTVDRVEVRDGAVTVVRPGKDPMTPEKVEKIQQIFIDRVAKSKCLAGEFGERVKSSNINRLIASAIKNVSNKEKPSDTESNPNPELNL